MFRKVRYEEVEVVVVVHVDDILAHDKTLATRRVKRLEETL